jgi:hypothetical protein
MAAPGRHRDFAARTGDLAAVAGERNVGGRIDRGHRSPDDGLDAPDGIAGLEETLNDGLSSFGASLAFE